MYRKTYFHRFNVFCFEHTYKRILRSCCHKMFETIKTDLKVWKCRFFSNRCDSEVHTKSFKMDNYAFFFLNFVNSMKGRYVVLKFFFNFSTENLFKKSLKLSNEWHEFLQKLLIVTPQLCFRSCYLNVFNVYSCFSAASCST